MIDTSLSTFTKSSHYFPHPLQEFVFFDKYARFNGERRESWEETVDRLVSFLHELAGSRVDAEVYQWLRTMILEMQAMPAMRLLATAGPAARRNNMAGFNCTFQGVDDPASFHEMLLISMNGAGGGYSVERTFTDNLPQVRRWQAGAPRQQFVVEDTTEGWAAALEYAVASWYAGEDVAFDYSEIRPAGAPLRTKGGSASGPEPLRQLLDFSREIFRGAQGRQLRPLEISDIFGKLGQVVASGGHRRSAMIALFDYDDVEMRQSKMGDFDVENPQRWSANISAVWPDEGLTRGAFDAQWHDMVSGQRGEPGIFNRAGIMQRMPDDRAKTDANGAPIKFGTNPCLTGDTWVTTDVGPRQITDLVGTACKLRLNGQLYSTTYTGFFYQGDKEVFEVQTAAGYTIRATANHKFLTEDGWREVQHLKPTDHLIIDNSSGGEWPGAGDRDTGWLAGHWVGNGTIASNHYALDFWSESLAGEALSIIRRYWDDARISYNEEYVRYRIWSPGFNEFMADMGLTKDDVSRAQYGSSDFYEGFLAGLFDADGSVQGQRAKGYSIRLTQVRRHVLRTAQNMLLRLGVKSVIYDNRREAGQTLLPDGRGGKKLYSTQAIHDLVISSQNIATFAERIGLRHADKSVKLDRIVSSMNFYSSRFTTTIQSIERVGVEPVYDCTIPDVHAFEANGLVSHNCGEIWLRPKQTCNLSSAVARPGLTLEDMRRRVMAATMIGTIQSLMDYFPGFRPEWAQNQQEERLLGVDINGWRDVPMLNDPQVVQQLRDTAYMTNAAFSEQLGINRAAAITCVKPSGNSSQLLDVSSGVHARWRKFYRRNVRVTANTSMYWTLVEAGVPMDPENGQDWDTATTWVAHFYVQAPEEATTVENLSAIDQAEFWLHVMDNWTYNVGHNVSITVTYKPEEAEELGEWVWKHRDSIAGLAFLPFDPTMYQQMPYEEISEAEYRKEAKRFPKIDFSRLVYYDAGRDETKSAQELACAAGACSLDDVAVK
jgi:ribonucleotide reductase class II